MATAPAIPLSKGNLCRKIVTSKCHCWALILRTLKCKGRNTIRVSICATYASKVFALVTTSNFSSYDRRGYGKKYESMKLLSRCT